MKNMASPLELAVKFEVEGRDYFLSAAEKTEHPLGKRMFKALAQDENKHIQKIRQLKKALKDNNEWPEDVPPTSEDDSISSIFEDAMKEIDRDVKPSDSDLEVIRKALELESKGFEFYTELASQESDIKAKKFYEALANEEKEHFAILQNTEKYFKNPADWFCEEERPMFEG